MKSLGGGFAEGSRLRRLPSGEIVCLMKVAVPGERFSKELVCFIYNLN